MAMVPRGVQIALLVACAAHGAGCSFGPRALERTHGRYAESVRTVEEEQLLRQIVLLRYNETAVSLDVSNIAAQYELSGSAEARPFFIAPNPSNSNVIFKTFTSILPDASLGWANRPTVSLTPINDGSAVRRAMTPITLDTLVFLTQTNWPVSTILRVWVDRMNGVPNAAAANLPPRESAPDFERFVRVAELLQAAQDKELAAVRPGERVVEVGGPFPADAVGPAAAVEATKAGLEYRRSADGKGWSLVRRERRLFVEVSPGVERSPELVELAALLNMTPGLKSYEISLAGRGQPDPARFPTAPSGELRVVPRSSAQAAYFLSNGVEVPAEHLSSGVVRPVVGPGGEPFDLTAVTRGLFAVHACKGHKRPAGAFVAVQYRGYWYYIDDRDQESKSTFALLFHLGRLDFARQHIGGPPALTLPVGR
jgi:hypothetical protein